MQPCHITQAQRMDSLSHLTPWSYQQFERCLHTPNQTWVLQQHKQILGFAVLRLVLDEAELLNFVIEPTYQRQGLGKRLLTFICKQVQDMQASHLFLEVRRSNQAAINLYQQAGFYFIATRKNYYPSLLGKEDALILRKDF